MPQTETFIRCLPNYWDQCSAFLCLPLRFLTFSSYPHTQIVQKDQNTKSIISIKYKIWNLQYKCNIVKTGQRSLLSVWMDTYDVSSYTEMQKKQENTGIILTYTMLPQGWIVLHKEEEGWSIQSRVIWWSCYMCEWWEFVPYQSVCMCESLSKNTMLMMPTGVGKFCPRRACSSDWAAALRTASACRCGRWVWGRGRALSPCTSSSCHCAATWGPCRQSPEERRNKGTILVQQLNKNPTWSELKVIRGYAHVFWKDLREAPALGQYLWCTAWLPPPSTGWGPGRSALDSRGGCLRVKIHRWTNEWVNRWINK